MIPSLFPTALAVALLAAAPASKSKLEVGQRAFNQGDFEAALRALDQAVQESSDPAVLEKVHLLRGQCYGARQDFVRAEEAFALALDANPEAGLDPAKVDPSLVRVLDSLRARTKGTLVIHSTPDGASLKLDGAPFGKAPQSAQVPIGRHKLEVQYEGAPPVTSEIVVHARGEARVEAMQAPNLTPVPGVDESQGKKVRPYADLRGVFETGAPEGGIEVGGGIEVPWVRLGVYARVYSTFEPIPRISAVVPLQVLPLSALIEAEVPFAFGRDGVGIGLGGAGGVEWGLTKWFGLYAQVGGRYYFTYYDTSCCRVNARFTASGGARLRLP